MNALESRTHIEKAAAEVRVSADEAEKAAWAEGIEPNGPLGGFVRSFKWAFVKIADLIERADASMSRRMDAQEKQIEAFHRLGETEIVKLRESNKLAALTVRQAELVQETIITNVCKDLGRNLLSESQEWLVLTEKDLHRNRSRIYAVKMTLAALALLGASFAGGYQLRAWEDDPAVQSLARCIKSPLRVVVEGGQPTGDWTCKLDTLVPRSWRDMPADMQRRWLWLWRYATG